MAAKQDAESLKAALDGATATTNKTKAQLELAKAEFVRGKQLLESNAITTDEYQRRERNQEVANASYEEAMAGRKQAQLQYDSQIDGVNTAVIQAEEQLKSAIAAEEKAQLALASTINGEDTTVAQLKAQLINAQYDLDQTTVTAPVDGFVIGMSLRPGQRVAAFPMRSWMAFVDVENTTAVVGIDQFALRHVKTGQKAEIVLKLYPGKTFTATVEKVGYMTPEGQVQPSGNVVLAPTRNTTPLPYGVVLKIDDPRIRLSELPAGGTGTAAIYTDSMKATHVIRRVMVRMQTYTNYFIPW